MASLKEQVADNLKAVVQAALPNGDVKRNAKTPTALPPGGLVVIHDGDPGQPEVTLSPLAYTYSHRFRLDVAAYESATETREQVLDSMLQAIGAGIEADRSLGGLCDWVEADAPITDDVAGDGSEPFRFAEVDVVCVYTTSSPLG